MEENKVMEIYDVCDYIVKRTLGESDMLKILNEFTNGDKSSSLLDKISNDIGTYINYHRETITEKELEDLIRGKGTNNLPDEYSKYFYSSRKEKNVFSLNELPYPFELHKLIVFQRIVNKQKNSSENIISQNILKWKGNDLQLTELIEGLIEVGVLPPSLSKKEIYERFKVFFDTDIDYTERKKTIRKRTNNLTPFIDELRDSVENWIKNKDE